MYVDKYGLIVQQSGDGGDTAARMGEYYALRAMKTQLGIPLLPTLNVCSFNAALLLLTVNGDLIRYPDAPYNVPTDTSRDQTRPMIIAAGLLDFKRAVELYAPKGFILKKYPNGDVASPENGNEVRRALDQDPTFLGDFWAWGDAYTRCLNAKKNGPDDVGDDINTFLTLAFFNTVKPTDEARDALRYYLVNRPTNYGVTTMGIADPVQGAFAWYHRSATGGNPEIASEAFDLISYFRKVLGAKWNQ